MLQTNEILLGVAGGVAVAASVGLVAWYWNRPAIRFLPFVAATIFALSWRWGDDWVDLLISALIANALAAILVLIVWLEVRKKS